MSELLNINEEQRLRLLVNAVTDYAIYMLDPAGHVATWNPGAQRFKGYTADEIIGQHFSRFFSAEDQAQDLPARALRVAAREGRFEAEGWRVRNDGTRFWAHAIIDPIRGDDGSLIGFAKVVRDVTDKRAQQQALFESEQRFMMLVEGVRDYAIYMLDTEGQITNWNSGAQAIKGYSAAEIVGQHFSQFYTEEDRARGEPSRALQTALDEGKYEREAQRVRKDGSLFWAHVVIDPIFAEDGSHVGFAKITRDITERKLAEDELEQTRAALAQSQKLQALGELTGGIAHDFNNLMTVISGSSDFLLRRPDLPDDKRKQYLQAIAETADRASTLTSHLLTFGRRQAIKPEVMDLNHRLDAVAEMLSRTIGSKCGLTLDLNADPAIVETDPTQLETAILNATLNARDALGEGGSITLATSNVVDQGKPFVRLAIIDDGEGMTQEVIDRAFEPFFTTKDVGKGTGLGLSLVYGIVTDSSGAIDVRSTPGQGSRFAVYLPKVDSPAQVENAPDGPLERGRGERVLIVDDEEALVAVTSEVLKQLGYEPAAFFDGAAALAQFDAAPERFDAVLTDEVMPGLSGTELARALRGRRADLPIILVSGYIGPLISERARGAGVDAILTKPVQSRELAAALARVLRRQSGSDPD